MLSMRTRPPASLRLGSLIFISTLLSLSPGRAASARRGSLSLGPFSPRPKRGEVARAVRPRIDPDGGLLASAVIGRPAVPGLRPAAALDLPSPVVGCLVKVQQLTESRGG